MTQINKPSWVSPELVTLRSARQAMTGDSPSIFETGGNNDDSSTPSGAV